MGLQRSVLALCAPLALALSAGCGSAAAPSAASATPSAAASAPSATATSTPTPLPTPVPTLAATADQLVAVAMAVYPACQGSGGACVSSGTKYTACDQGTTPRWATCPLTPRLVTQFDALAQAVQSAPDPLGGGQDPAWATEVVTAEPSAGGGVAHVTLGFGGGTASHTDLSVIVMSGKLLVDDVYCTGTDPATTDAYAPGWLNRSTC